MKKILLTIVTLLFMIPLAAVPAVAQDNGQNFEAVNPANDDEDTSFLDCLDGWRQFISAGVGFNDFSDYFRDFFLTPLHYSDVANVESQLNKARNAVMSAFLRCEQDRLDLLTRQYYKLDAELYYLRHFVDTEGGFLKILTESPGDRELFIQEMQDYFILRKESENPDDDRILFEAYFQEFESKYRERAKAYKGYGSDPAYSELAAKFKEFVETMKSFGELGSELAQLGNEAIVEPAKSVGKAAVNLFESPASTLKQAAKAVASKFEACVETPTSRYCFPFDGTEAADPFAETFSSGQKRTFEEVQVAIQEQQLAKTQDLDQAQMLTRYEVLYGQVSGQGISATISTMDSLLKLLNENSLAALKKVQQCAYEVRNRQCK